MCFGSAAIKDHLATGYTDFFYVADMKLEVIFRRANAPLPDYQSVSAYCELTSLGTQLFYSAIATCVCHWQPDSSAASDVLIPMHTLTHLYNVTLEYVLENARHCGASLIEYTRRTWSGNMHLTVIRMWLNLRPQKIT